MRSGTLEGPARGARALGRRAFLVRAGAGAAATYILLPGCGGFPPESGAAFEPWRYPREGEPPELQAVSAAILAASPHNTQPWLFRVTPAQIDVFADPDRNLGPMDALRRELHLGLGCAVENLVLGARQHGRLAEVTLLPDAGDATHVARVALVEGPTPEASSLEARLARAIARRRTHRGRYLEAPAPATLEADLRALVDAPAVHLTFLEDPGAMASFRAGTIAATEAIVADREMNEASHRWYRHAADDLRTHRDGTTLDATGNGAGVRFFGKITGRPDADTAGNYWLAATRDAQTTASAFVILSTPQRNDRREQLLCGRVFERLHLWATDVGLAVQPLNQMAEVQDREESLGRDPVFARRLAALVPVPGLGPQLLFRIGYAWDEAFASPRRPLDWVTT